MLGPALPLAIPTTPAPSNASPLAVSNSAVLVVELRVNEPVRHVLTKTCPLPLYGGTSQILAPLMSSRQTSPALSAASWGETGLLTPWLPTINCPPGFVSSEKVPLEPFGTAFPTHTLLELSTPTAVIPRIPVLVNPDAGDSSMPRLLNSFTPAPLAIHRLLWASNATSLPPPAMPA